MSKHHHHHPPTHTAAAPTAPAPAPVPVSDEVIKSLKTIEAKLDEIGQRLGAGTGTIIPGTPGLPIIKPPYPTPCPPDSKSLFPASASPPAEDKRMGKLRQLIAEFKARTVDEETEFKLRGENRKAFAEEQKRRLDILQRAKDAFKDWKDGLTPASATPPVEPPWLTRLKNDAATAKDLSTATQSYKWTVGDQQYPSHVSTPLPSSEAWSSFSLFSATGVLALASAKAEQLIINGWAFFNSAYARYQKLSDVPTQPANDLIHFNGGPTIGSDLRDDWWSDTNFGNQRMYGANPALIRCQRTVPDLLGSKVKYTAADFTALFNKLKLPAFETELKAGRVFSCDYEILGTVTPPPPGSDNETPEVISDRWCAVPIVVLHYQPGDQKAAVPGQLKPVYIQIDQTASAGVFTPSTTVPPASDWPWRFAKMCCQSADLLYHEIGSHLTYTHLIEELFIVASHRQLPVDHPVMLLMADHFLKTLSLNDAARTSLMPTFISQLAPYPNVTNVQLVGKFFEQYNFSAKMPPNDLKARGFTDDVIAGMPEYHYANKALRTWNLWHSYVLGILNTFYDNDNQVKTDPYLQKWANEITGIGALKGFKADTIASLADTISMAMFTATFQHSAVNYQQYYYFGYSPNSSGSMYGLIPKNQNDIAAIDEAMVVRALPPKITCVMATALVFILSQAPTDPLEASLTSYQTAFSSPVQKQLYSDFLAGMSAESSRVMTAGQPTAFETAYAPSKSGPSIEI